MPSNHIFFTKLEQYCIEALSSSFHFASNIVAISVTMAKIVFLVAVLLVVTVAMTEAGSLEDGIFKRKPVDLSVTLVCHNNAHRDVSILVAELKIAKVVSVLKNKAATIGPIVVDVKVNPLLHLTITVLDNKHALVKKTLIIDLVKQLKVKLVGKKTLLLNIVEDVKAKLLKVYLGAEIVLIIKL